MADNNNAVETRQIYYIPENYIGESRIWQGRIRTRYLIDSIILGAFGGIFGLILLLTVLANSTISVKITGFIITVAPGVLIGQLGYNGDPVSVAFVNFLQWRKSRQIRLFNPNMKLLGTDPVKAISESESGKDRIVSKYQSWQDKRREKKESEQYIEGETFEFQDDPDIDNYTGDNVDYADGAHSSLSDEKVEVSITSGNDLDDLDDLFGDLEDDDSFGY